MISQVPLEQLGSVWEYLEPLISEGLAYGQGDSLTSDDVFDAINEGEMILWAAHDEESLFGGMVFEVNETARKKTIFVVILVGSHSEKWADELESELFQYQKLIKADCIEASCRKGLARQLMNRGWKQKAIIMEAPNGR